jgi:hypothetical protein
MAASDNNKAPPFVPLVRTARPPWDPADWCGEEAPWRDDPEPPRPHWDVRHLADLAPADASWLWPAWMALPSLTLLDGETGVGKTALALDLAARLSRGAPWPDGCPGIRGAALLLCAAGGAATTLRPRLLALGADPRRILLAADWRGPHGDYPPQLPRDLPFLEELLGTHAVQLLVLDPLLEFLGVNAGNDQAAGRCLDRLARVAERTACAVLGLRPWGRRGGGRPLLLGVGAVALAAAAQTVLVAAADPDRPGRGVLAVAKGSLGPRPAALAYRITAGPGGGFACRVAWQGPAPYAAEHLCARPLSAEDRARQREAKGQRQACADFLKQLLAAGPLAAGECKRICAEAGFSRRTAERAACRLGVVVGRQATPSGHAYEWNLPEGERGAQAATGESIEG